MYDYIQAVVNQLPLSSDIASSINGISLYTPAGVQPFIDYKTEKRGGEGGGEK